MSSNIIPTGTDDPVSLMSGIGPNLDARQSAPDKMDPDSLASCLANVTLNVEDLYRHLRTLSQFELRNVVGASLDVELDHRDPGRFRNLAVHYASLDERCFDMVQAYMGTIYCKIVATLRQSQHTDEEKFNSALDQLGMVMKTIADLDDECEASKKWGGKDAHSYAVDKAIADMKRTRRETFFVEIDIDGPATVGTIREIGTGTFQFRMSNSWSEEEYM